MQQAQEQDLDYRHILKTEFNYRQKKNTSYSLRSFARDLGLSPSRLSEVLNNKGDLSAQSLMDIGAKLGISTPEILALKAFMELRNSSSEEVKASAQKYLDNYEYQGKFQQITTDTFAVLADWYHFAILSCMEMNMYDGSVAFLSRAMRLDTKTVEDALNRMMAHKMVNFHHDKYFPTGEMFTTTHDISSAALQESHRQTLDFAKGTLTSVDVGMRDITSNTICIDVDKIPEAKQMIKEFRRNLSRFLESGKKNAVYSINIQLHPFSEVIRENPLQ